MKQLLFFLFVFSSAFAQKKYAFDYIAEYVFQKGDNSKSEKRFLLTNSKQNSYALEVIIKDSLSFYLCFHDENGINSKAEIFQKDFFNAKTINLDCSTISPYKNPFKFQVDNYKFTVKEDTLIEGEKFQYYILKSINSKREKRKKRATAFYIVEKNTSHHLPYFNISTAYEVWKANRNIPNGLHKYFYFKNFEGKITTMYKLLQFHQINKTITVPSDCDYTPK